MWKNCERCTKPFYAYPYNEAKRRFCSRICSNKSTSFQQMKTKHVNSAIKAGKKKWRYTHAYNNWRNQCISRDGYSCKNCSRELNLRSLVVHHIKPYKDFPNLRYDVDNGIVLCRSCHNLIHILPNRKINHGF